MGRRSSARSLPARFPSRVLPSARRAGVAAALAAVLVLGASAAHAVGLADAIRSAESADPALAAASASREAAQLAPAIARARLLPQVSVVRTQSRTHQNVVQQNAVANSDRSYNVEAVSTAVQMRQALYRPREWTELDVGALQASLGEHRLAAARADLWMRTANAWIDLAAAVEQRRSIDAIVASVDNAAAQERLRFERGDGTRDAMVEAQAQAAVARAQAAEAAATLGARLHALRLLTGRGADRLGPPQALSMRLPPSDEVQPPIADEATLQGLAAEHNPALLARRTEEAMQGRRVEQVRGDGMPQLDMVGTLSRSSNDMLTTLNQTYTNAAIGVQLQVPMFAGGGYLLAERQALATWSASSAEARMVAQQLSAQINGDWNGLVAANARAGGAQVLLDAAREQRRAAELGVRAGLRTWSDVASADLLISRRESDWIQWRAIALKTHARLLSVLPVDDPAWSRWTAAFPAAQ